MRRLALIALLSGGWFLSIGTDCHAQARRGAAVVKLLGPLEAAFARMDPDGDGFAEQADFVRVLNDASNGRVSSIAAQIFQTFDADHDKKLTLAELKAVQGPEAASTDPAKPSTESARPSTDPAKPGDPAQPAAKKKPARDIPVVEIQPEPPVATRGWDPTAAAEMTHQLDDLLAAALAGEGREFSPPLNDEQFLRRLSLDLTGHPPTADELEAFVNSTASDKRAQAAARLLDSEQFGRTWGHLWKDVMQSKASSTQVIYELHRGKSLEDWLCRHINANQSWAEIANSLITATGAVFVPGDDVGTPVGLLLCHTGKDTEPPRATDVTRIFLGIQLECAQCHDHPTDIWQRQQFHELAAYFAKIREGNCLNAASQRGYQLTSAPGGQYAMPDKMDVSKTTPMTAKFFLTGESPPAGADDLTLRSTLARQITASEWFPKAFVNRTWGQLIGRGFVEPIDDLGPSHDPIYPDVLEALAASFSGSDFNVKQLIAAIVGSRAYQQQVRFGDGRNEHLHFAGAYPMRMRGEELWDTITVAIGPFAEKTPLPDGLRAVLDRIQTPDFFTTFKKLFDYDPSFNPNDVEAGVAQSLMLLNNPEINAQIKGEGSTLLASVLEKYPEDKDAIRHVYLQVVNRSPTAEELASCQEYFDRINSRRESLEDLMWVLVNSAEFRVKH